MRWQKISLAILLFSSITIFSACGPSTISNIVNSDNSNSSSSSNSTTTSKITTYTIPKISEATKMEYLRVINEARAKRRNCGYEGVKEPAPPLKWSNKLYRAAYEHTYDMAMSNMQPISHNGSGTVYDITAKERGLSHSTMSDRVENSGYNYKYIGENIAAGTNTDTIQEAMKQWLNSPGHCANIMNPNFTEIGVAHIKRDKTHYINYWTQVFGSSGY